MGTLITYSFWRDIAFYIAPKPYKNNHFWRDIGFYITPKLSEINQTKSPGGLLNPTPAVIFPLSGMLDPAYFATGLAKSLVEVQGISV